LQDRPKDEAAVFALQPHLSKKPHQQHALEFREMSLYRTMKKLCWPLSLCVFALALSACRSHPPIKALPQAGAAVQGSAPGPAYGKAAVGEFIWTPSINRVFKHLEPTLSEAGASVVKTTDDRMWIVLAGASSFEPQRSALKPTAQTQLDKIAQQLRALPMAELRIIGHTDLNRGALSLERAASTRDWLVARGIPAMRITVAGRGGADPIASNSTETGRTLNRRIDILIGQRP
jgi:flagellar motor protein MotB